MSLPRIQVPRLMVAGLAGDTGKSLVSLGLIRSFLTKGDRVAPFKKGPDFIDAAWLGAAAGLPARNLDTFLMAPEVIKESVWRASVGADIAVIEGNRGLFDGMDSAGSHSTAELAKIIGAPVVLVVEVTKTTRTVAALVKGCQALDSDLTIAGVILNRVGTKRQESVIRSAIRSETGLPVVGAIPKLTKQHLPSRHLGLVTAMEHPDVTSALEEVGNVVTRYVDVDQVFDLACSNSSEVNVRISEDLKPKLPKSVRIGVLKDKAFSFYYPENLEALESRGAEIVNISPLEDELLPDVDGIYAGGGFPEVHANELSNNESFRQDLKKRVLEGLPVWAECGGLMYMAKSLDMEGRTYPMVGALPIEVVHQEKPEGHGYVRARVDLENPFFAIGTDILGHEFHYSRLKTDPKDLATILELKRGTGIGNGRDGIRFEAVVATYTHLHALGTSDWAEGLVRTMAGGD